MLVYVLMGIVMLAVCAGMIWAIVVYRQKFFLETLSRDEGDFIIKGEKEKFVIQKNERFEFAVIDGQIVSVKDKMASTSPIQYGEIING